MLDRKTRTGRRASGLPRLSDRTRIGRSEYGIYEGVVLRRGFVAKPHLAWPAPPSTVRRDIRPLAKLPRTEGFEYAPSSLASERGNLRRNETLLALHDGLFATADGGRVAGGISLAFRLAGGPEAIAALLNEGILQQIGHELPRRVRSAVASEISRWPQREALSAVPAIREASLAALAAAVSPQDDGPTNLGIRLTGLTLVLRTSDLQQRAKGEAQRTDLITDIARIRDSWARGDREAWEVPGYERVLDGIIRQHLLATVAQSNQLFVVPTEAAGLLGSYRDMGALTAGHTDRLAATGPPMRRIERPLDARRFLN
ncbi:MAG: hypothetical protein V2J26_06455 [Pacificimonas sp.]|jgi:hypothetical protein|nr:hypothetical protein [Pacificimonas sp.]